MHQVTGARFLPFDPSAFVFSDRPGMTRGDQEDAMRALNQTFLAAAPSDVLAETVRGWYGGGQTLQGAADTSVVPAAWQGADSAPLYRNVIATACRGCHASRGDALAFATPGQFRARAGQIVQAICGTGSDAAHRDVIGVVRRVDPLGAHRDNPCVRVTPADLIPGQPFVGGDRDGGIVRLGHAGQVAGKHRASTLVLRKRVSSFWTNAMPFDGASDASEA